MVQSGVVMSSRAAAAGNTVLVEHPSSSAVARIVGGGARVEFCHGGRGHTFHSLWLRERSTTAGSVDPVNRQRLYEPLDVDADLRITWCRVSESRLLVEFSDGHHAEFLFDDLAEAIRAADGAVGEEEPPAPEPWVAAGFHVPVVSWEGLHGADHLDATIAALDAFFRYGFFVLRGTLAQPGALNTVAAHFGRISATNFGTLFDVRTVPAPVDLAYTPVALSAHTDQPYRRPTPGIQFLHAIVNDAPGGDSTIVDGLAAIRALREFDEQAYDVLSTLPVEYRYDIGTDVKVARAPMIELRPDGTLRQFRFSTRLDYAPAADPDVLDVYYRGRRWLAAALNDPARQVQFRLLAGDVAVVDNHRVLHGRTAFDSTGGARHLQGCYIDHDGPATMWTLAMRRLRAEATPR